MKDIKLSKQKIIDYHLGNLINLFLIFKKKLSQRLIPSHPKIIIIYKLDAIGDSVLCLPMIKSLKGKTNAKIVVACSKSNFDIFQDQKFIDKIIIFDSSKFNLSNLSNNLKKLRNERADISIDTGQTANLSAIMAFLTSKYSIGFSKGDKEIRNKVYDSSIKIDYDKHMVQNYFGLVKDLRIHTPKEPKLVKLVYDKKDFNKLTKIVGRRNKLVAIHPFHSIYSKQWPLERFAKIIEFLVSKKYSVIIVNDKNESSLMKKLFNKIDKKIGEGVIDLSGDLNLKELIALMTKLNLFIANDGGPMHIAAAMEVPTIGLFGYENPEKYGPIGKDNISLYHVKDHGECEKKFLVEWPKCRNPKHIKEVSVEEVKKAIAKIESRR